MRVGKDCRLHITPAQERGQVWEDSRRNQEACCKPGLHLAHTAVPGHQGTGSQDKSYSRGARDKARDKAMAV